MDFVPAVGHVLTNYAKFDGRAARSEYWWFVLFVILAEVALIVLGTVLAIILGDAGSTLGQLLYYVFLLCLLVPSIAVTIRRLHDTDRSGWWIFIGLVPVLGPILLIIWYCTKGSLGPNRFGSDPFI
jgi:uncharacterized membrane protein YhaH (DUF805 family)